MEPYHPNTICAYKEAKKDIAWKTVKTPLVAPLQGHCADSYCIIFVGRPKGVMMTHLNVISNLLQVKSVQEQGELYEVMKDMLVGMNQIAVLPFFHAAGLFGHVIGSMMRGSTSVVLAKFDPKVFLQTIADYKVMFLMLVPPLMLFLARHPLVAEYDLSCVRFILSGAAPLSKELADEVSNRLGAGAVMVSQAYGRTEMSPASHILPPGTSKTGSVGVLLPNTVCKLINSDTGELCGAGEAGEMIIRGPQVMKGYLNRPEETRNTIDSEGYLHTGDVAYYDSDGYFFIVDRIKELIKYKAYQVAPAELEALLLTHPAILDCGVIGKPDEASGELPMAFVVLRATHRGKTTPNEIVEWVDDKVSPHKKLRGGVKIMQRIPKTDTGKILRRVLKQQASGKAKL